MQTSIFQLGREDFQRGENRPDHYPERAAGWDFEQEKYLREWVADHEFSWTLKQKEPTA